MKVFFFFWGGRGEAFNVLALRRGFRVSGFRV